MELLSVAQKYQRFRTCSHPGHHRSTLSNTHPSKTTTPRLFSCIQVRPSTRSASVLANHRKIPMTREDYDNKLGIVPLARVPRLELWKYHEKSRAILASDLTAFRALWGSRRDNDGLRLFPSWLDQSIESIRNAPNLLYLISSNSRSSWRAPRHTFESNLRMGCRCASIQYPARQYALFGQLWRLLC
jgi:hypothetical protein